MTRAIIVKIPFAEAEDFIAPTDLAGGLEDLTGDAGSSPALDVATVVSSPAGVSRQFGTDKGFIAADIDDATALRRSMSVQALLTWDHAAQVTRATAGIIVARGVQGGSVERQSWGMRLGTSGANGTIEALWQDPAGADAVVGSKPFTAPDADQPILLTMVRRWVSISRVDVDYYVNELYLGSVTSTDGIIGGESGGTTSIGCQGDGAGNYELFVDATIHSLIVINGVLELEDVQNSYRRIFVYRPQGYSFVKPLQPAGVWSEDPESRVQKVFKNYGAALGDYFASIQDVINVALPDRATDLIEDWERVTKLAPLPIDPFQTRRNRILSFLRTVEGYSISQVPSALEAVLGLTAAQIEIIEGSNLTLAALAATPDYMSEVGRAHAAPFTYGARLTLATDAAAAAGWGNATAPYLKQSIGNDPTEADQYGQHDHEVQFRNLALSTVDDAVGIMAYEPATGDGVFLCATYTGSSTINIREFVAGVWGSPVTVKAASGSQNYLRLRRDGAGAFTGLVGAVSGTYPDLAALVYTGAEPTNIALVALNFGGAATTAIGADLDSWRSYQPRSLAPFCWGAYRDPALGGSYDIRGAQAVIDNLSPGHTSGCAVDNKDLVCDDPASLVGCALLHGSTL